MRRAVPLRWSLRRRLLIQLLAVFCVLALLLYVSVRVIAERAADTTQDYTLGASALAVAEQASFVGDEATIDIPYMALSVLGASGDDRVFYKASIPPDRVLTGYPALPDPAAVPAPGELVFFDAVYDGEAIRVASASRRISGAGQTATVLVSIAQTREAYEAISSSIAAAAAIVGVGFLILAGGLSWLAVTRALRPLAEIGITLRQRGPRDIEALDAPAPKEVAPLIDSLNGFLRRLRGMLATAEDFIAEAAHRVRTPLAGVRAQAELALRLADDAEQRAALRRVLRAVDETAQSTNQLLNHAMVAYRADRVALDRVDLNNLAAKAVKDAWAAADMRHITLEVAPAGAPVVTPGDEILLLEALRNLIDNAVKYSPDEARVFINVRHDGNGNGLVEVADAGRGVPAGEHRQVRTRFKRGSNAGTIVGSGLGLTIVEQVMAAHDGELRLEPNEPDGLRASLVLPLAPGSVT